jgi:acetamidase/formamidase
VSGPGPAHSRSIHNVGAESAACVWGDSAEPVPEVESGAVDRAIIDHIVARYGRSRQEAYPIAWVAVDLRIHEVADVPDWVVGALLPETIFTEGAPPQ